MKRNWDVIRHLLLKIEEKKGYGNWVAPDALLPDYDTDEVAYHIGLLIEAGYINGIAPSDYDLIRGFSASSLTWEGHELLDKIRNDTIWNRVKSTALEKGVDLSVGVVKSIASKVIESLISS